MFKTRTGRITSAAVAATAALALGSGVASATVFVSDYTTGTNIRATQYTNSAINGVGYPGHGTNDWCWVHGTSVNGSDLWDSNTDRATGVWGYSAEQYISGAYLGQTTPC
ncbi:hypothetical protein [Streptomyces sp. CBMA156]|uniref:hypothetical protein n=1 Tax=Streptomyces sp. CBMA156 TaxID=1930280 RepID=UPI0016619304|nr:hypothetical protein [Streptomyces sp. CBMA156]MBD0675944.1 hypothetical protein [Streptomyces sp. CBMA156]